MKPWQIVVTIIAVVALGLGAFGTYQSIGLGNRAGDIEEDVSSVELRASILEGNVSAIDADIISIETDIGTLQVDLSDVNAEITSIEGNIATIETDIGTLQVDVSDINAEITSIEGDIATIETDVGTIEVNITTINGKITSIEGDIATIETDVGTLETNVSAINARVTTIEGNVATIETDIGTLQADVSALESLVTVPPPESFGPITIDVGTGEVGRLVDIAHPMDRVEFQFDVSGGPVWYIVIDTDLNVILYNVWWDLNIPVSSGAGAFVAPASGTYVIDFWHATGSPSTVTLYYTVYSAAPVVYGE